MNKVIAFVGMPGSGKSLVATFLKEYVEVLHVGDLTLETLKKRKLGVNEENERAVREGLREEFGMDVYAKRVAEKADASDSEIVMFDGVRSLEEYIFLKKKYGEKFVLISLLASPETRHARLMKREERPLTKEECESRDFTEMTNLNLGNTIAMGDVYIVNEGSVEELENDVKRVVEEFINK